MYSHTIPLSIDEYINTITYPVEVPEYAIVKPESYRNREIINLFVPDKNNLVLSRATVAMMVDFNDRVIPFKIINSDDVIEIHRYLESYLFELGNYVEIEEARMYFVKAQSLFTKIERSVQLLANRGNLKARQQINHANILNIIREAAST